MKRTSKRTSRRPRRASRRMQPNRSVDSRMFGREIDPDKITGARGRDLDGAMDRYEIFQQKAPQRIVEVDHDVPTQLVPVGDCVSVMYRSNKWYDEGTPDEDYKHRHEPSENKQYEPGKGVILYENAKFADRSVKKNNGIVPMPRTAPGAWARLAYCLGFFVRKDDGEIYECNPRNTWLCASPDGHMLAVYSDKQGFLCVMAGGKLRTLKEGIDG